MRLSTEKIAGGGIRKGGGSEVFFLLGWDRMVSRGDGGGGKSSLTEYKGGNPRSFTANEGGGGVIGILPSLRRIK